MTIASDTITTTQETPSMTAAETSAEYWVTRVVRQMKGCSPAKIDSVIQANLPPRKIRWSQRPDTLEIPGLKGRLAYSIDNQPKYNQPGFFADNPLFSHEICIKPIGVESLHLQHNAIGNDAITTLLVVLFGLSVILARKTARFTAYHFNEFTAPLKKAQTSNTLPPALGAISLFTAYALLSLTASLLIFNYTTQNIDFIYCPLSPELIYGIFAGCFTVFFAVKIFFSTFINWIFFDKTSRQAWRDSFNYLLIGETLLLVMVCIIGNLGNIIQERTIMIAAIVVILFKMALLYKTQAIFFPKLYCILHLLSYLCALEIIPLISLWVGLTHITDRLSIIY